MNWLASRAALATAAVYAYFLIFPQFSYVEILRANNAGPTWEKMALAIMAVAGITSGFLTAARGVNPRRVRIAMLLAGLAAVAAPFCGSLPILLGLAALSGAALGVATVGLSALLPAWCGLGWVGLGTGLGYAACNLPPVFQQSPAMQASIAAGFAAIAVLAIPAQAVWPARQNPKVFPFVAVVVVFMALVWLDSAAFFIIQHAAPLKASTWGESLLWRNAALHCTVAIAAGLWLGKGGARALPVVACALLAVAALAINTPATRGIGGWLYPAGVSLYSTALVAWPGWFAGVTGTRAAAWRAAWLFGVAGWLGSANGVGMAQSLHHVPTGFAVAAMAVTLTATFLTESRWPAWLAVLSVVGIALALQPRPAPSPATAAERGRRVYVAEGCIHCHSQYVRPGSRDETLWGPPKTVEQVMKGDPVLIGNRRHGPDLTNVGTRRSQAWLRIHFIRPQALVPDSTMPSYAYLFEDNRGNDLIQYLKQSGAPDATYVAATAAQWQPSGTTAGTDGKTLFLAQCTPCHGPQGRGDGPLANQLLKPPANLVTGPLIWTRPAPDLDLRIARLIKFGIPGTDMPGHEVLTDSQVNALVAEVVALRAEPAPN